MNIGILLPRSNAHPSMGFDFYDGLRSCLDHNQLAAHFQITTENIGFGGNDKEVYEKAEKLLLINNADILIAYIDLKVVPILGPLMYSTGKLLLVVNPGANYPNNWLARPNILFLSLQHAFLCSLAGVIASRSVAKPAVMATTFYDCGYLLLRLYSLLRGIRY